MSDLDRIKEKIDIVDYIGQHLNLKKAGRNFKANCPFHNEKTASFVVSPDRQIWHCFGACSEGGDIFKFLMKYENLSFPEALRDLAQQAGITLSSFKSDDKSWQIKEKLYEVNRLAAKYYRYLLQEHRLGEKARDYLKARQINPKTSETFNLGYAPSAWRNLFSFLKKRGFDEKFLEEAGLVIKKGINYYDRFRGRIIFPLQDNRGNIVGFSGRLLENDKNSAKYINSPETAVYRKREVLYGLFTNLQNLKKANNVVIVEGEFDVISAYQNGITNVVAAKGTALTESQLKLVKRFHEEVLLAFDADVAGDAAMRRSLEMAEDLGLNVRIVKLTDGKDLDEALQKNPLGVKKALKNPVGIYDFVLDSALKRYPTAEAFAKKKIGEEVLTWYAKISNPIIRNHYLKKLAGILDVSEEAILEQLEKLRREQAFGTTAKKGSLIPTTATPILRQDALEEHLLALVLQAKEPQEMLVFLKENLPVEILTNPAVKKIFEKILKLSSLNIHGFAKSLPEELLEIFNKSCLLDITRIIESEKKFKPELVKTLSELKRLNLKRKLNSLSSKIRGEGEEELKKLNEELRLISLELKKIKS